VPIRQGDLCALSQRSKHNKQHGENLLRLCAPRAIVRDAVFQKTAIGRKVRDNEDADGLGAADGVEADDGTVVGGERF
jgi:hypothetical protein